MNFEGETNGEPPYDLINRLYPDTRAWEVWKPSPDIQRLEALEEIGSKSVLSCLPYLAALIASGSTSVREKAAEVAARLLEASVADGSGWLSVGLHRLVAHDATSAAESLRQVKRDAIWSLQVSEAHSWAAFGLLSFHGNGWVREATLDRLSQLSDGKEIPFLLYRANDWVDLVAKKARDLLVVRLEGCDCLDLVDRGPSCS